MKVIKDSKEKIYRKNEILKRYEVFQKLLLESVWKENLLSGFDFIEFYKLNVIMKFYSCKFFAIIYFEK